MFAQVWIDAATRGNEPELRYRTGTLEVLPIGYQNFSVGVADGFNGQC